MASEILNHAYITKRKLKRTVSESFQMAEHAGMPGVAHPDRLEL
jgi:hypothetical protein